MTLGHLRHSGTRALTTLGTQALGHLGHSCTQTLRHLDTQCTQALGHLGTQTLKHLGHSRIQALRHLGNQSTQALGHSDTRALKALRHLGTWSLETLYLANSISGQIFGLILSFLSNRHLRVVLNGKSLQEYPVNIGVLQGSILLPIRFLLYLDYLPDNGTGI